jgi:predicted dehydrogenase
MLLAAMQAGKHAIGETPACMTLDECRQLRVALHEHPGLKLATGHVVRAWRTYSHAKRLVLQGALGEIFYLHSSYTHKPTPDEYPSQSTWGRSPRARMNMGIAYHSVDLLRWLVGPVEEVSGEFTQHARIAILRFASGALGHVFQSTSVVMPYSLPLYVYGTEGSLHCFWEEQTLKGNLHKSAEWAPEHLDPMPLHGRGSPEWRYELEAFVDSILTGGEPLCPLSEGIATVETCLAVDEAMMHQTRVRVRQA